MTEPVIHIRDNERRYNGSEGDWTVCGQPWPEQGQGAIFNQPGVGWCPDCLAEDPR